MIYGRIAEIALAIESLVYTPPIGDSAVRKALGGPGGPGGVNGGEKGDHGCEEIG